MLGKKRLNTITAQLLKSLNCLILFKSPDIISESSYVCKNPLFADHWQNALAWVAECFYFLTDVLISGMMHFSSSIIKTVSHCHSAIHCRISTFIAISLFQGF